MKLGIHFRLEEEERSRYEALAMKLGLKNLSQLIRLALEYFAENYKS